jgi:pSer/pThr/pTyr-binding forkhead associated (FHA) protein
MYYEIVASLLKYIFVTVIYLFIFGILRPMYMDVKYVSRKYARQLENKPYLKLLNIRDRINFQVDESYVVNDKTLIGRNKKNDICLPMQFFSDQHALIFKRNNDYYLEDLGSKNGTFLNNFRLDKGNPLQLKSGDIVQVGQMSQGQLSFVFVNISEEE